MRTTIFAFLVSAVAAFAGGIGLDPSQRYELLDCPKDGGAPRINPPRNTYLVTFLNEDTTLCFGISDGGTGGVGCFDRKNYTDAGILTGPRFPQGAGLLMSLPSQTSVSCFSADGGGDVFFTKSY